MGARFSNSASASLASDITSGATSITLQSGQGARFPSLAAGEYFYGTLSNSQNLLEVVKVTAVSGDTLTAVRGQDNTTAQTYNAGDKFELRLTAAALQNFAQLDGATMLGTLTLAGDPTSALQPATKQYVDAADTANATAAANAQTAANNAQAGVNTLNSTAMPKSGGTFTGDITVNGVITTNKGSLSVYGLSGNNSAGAVYLNSAQTRYVYFDGTSYQMAGANLFVNGSQAVLNNSGSYNISVTGSAGSAPPAQTSANTVGALTLQTVTFANSNSPYGLNSGVGFSGVPGSWRVLAMLYTGSNGDCVGNIYYNYHCLAQRYA